MCGNTRSIYVKSWMVTQARSWWESSWFVEEIQLFFFYSTFLRPYSHSNLFSIHSIPHAAATPSARWIPFQSSRNTSRSSYRIQHSTSSKYLQRVSSQVTSLFQLFASQGSLLILNISLHALPIPLRRFFEPIHLL